MTTTPDDDLRRADEETRVDVPAASDEASDARWSEQRPPAFPSVGGDANQDRVSYAESPFGAVHDEPLVAPTSPVGSAGSPLGGPADDRASRLRWMAAAVATLGVVAVVAGLFIFFGARPATPSLVAEFAPADAAIYTELRMDLPGDQRDGLVSFMSHFPGFADPSTFQQKIDDTLANALRSTGMGLDWKADVDPWFGGEIGLFSSTLAPSIGTPPSFSVVLSLKDRVKLDELVAARLTGSDMQQEDYKGQAIWSGSATDTAQRFSFAVTDEALVISARNEDLKAALDTKAGDVAGLADDQFFTTQLTQMHSDHLALVYYDTSTLVRSLPTGPSAILPPACLTDFAAAANTKLLGELRAEGDHISANVRSQYATGGDLPSAPANKRTSLAESMPGGTVAYIEMRQVGAGIKYLVTGLLSCMNATSGSGLDLSQIQQIIGTAPQDYFDFIDDAAFALTIEDGLFGGGLIATVDDENVARTRVERLLSALRLAGGMGGGITIEEQQHGDATISVVKFGEEIGVRHQAPTLAVTVSGGRVYLGLGDFVTAALDRTAADSLAATQRLQDALAAGGAENAGIVYLDLGALRGFLESPMPTDARPKYDTDVKPFVEPLTHLIVVSRNESGTNVAHAFLYVE